MDDLEIAPTTPDPTATREMVVSGTGFGFWWGGGFLDVPANMPTILERAQLDHLIQAFAGSKLDLPFRYVRFHKRQAVTVPTYVPMEAKRWALGLPPAPPSAEPPQVGSAPPVSAVGDLVTIVSDEHCAFQCGASLIEIRPRVKAHLTREQVEYLASMNFPFRELTKE
jgi:hypothetical protein